MFYIVIIVAILTAAALTNPAEEEHQQVVGEAMFKNASKSQTLNEVVYSSDAASTIEYFSEFVTADNFIFFSRTRFHTSLGSRTVGTGIFGKVHLAPEMKTLKLERPAE